MKEYSNGVKQNRKTRLQEEKNEQDFRDCLRQFDEMARLDQEQKQRRLDQEQKQRRLQGERDWQAYDGNQARLEVQDLLDCLRRLDEYARWGK